MSTELKEMIFEINNTFEALKSANEAKADKEQITRIQDAIDDMEKKMESKTMEKKDIYMESDETKGIMDYMMKGAVTDEMQTKADLASTDINKFGGYLLGTQMATSILERLRERSPMRDIAMLQTVSNANVYEEVIEGEQEYQAGFVGERSTRPSTDVGDLNIIRIPLNRIYAEPVFTRAQITDTRINFMNHLMMKLNERFDRVEGESFITGDGNEKPKGLIYNTNTITQTGDLTSNKLEVVVDALSFDGLINLTHQLEDPYEPNAKFVLHRETLRDIRILKDSEGQYLWNPMMQIGNPNTILGYEYKRMTHMPTPATGALSVAFGDFQQGYIVTDGMDMYTIRDEITSKGFVKYYTEKRVGGGIRMDKAIKLLQQS